MYKKINAHKDYISRHYIPNSEHRKFALDLLKEDMSFFDDLPDNDRVIEEKERYELVKDYINMSLGKYDNLAAILVCWVNGMLDCQEQAKMLYDLFCIPLQDRDKFNKGSVVKLIENVLPKVFYWKDKGGPVYEKE